MISAGGPRFTQVIRATGLYMYSVTNLTTQNVLSDPYDYQSFNNNNNNEDYLYSAQSLKKL